MVTLGVIGAGYWGTNVIRTFLNIKACHLKYVADLKPGRRAFVEEYFPQVDYVVEDYQRILEDPEIDGVSIVTTVSTHYPIAKEALKAGKHIYVEKPFTANSQEAKELIQIAKEKNRKILVGHLFEYHPAVEKIKELLKEQRIGDIYYIYAERMNLRPPATEVNVVWDLAPHDLSIIFYLLDKKPITISAYGKAFVNPKLEDSVFFRLNFENGQYATVQLNWLIPEKTRRMIIFGSHGVIVYNDMEPVDKIRIYDEGIDTRKNATDDANIFLTYKPGDIVIPALPTGQPLDKECRHFIEAIDRNLPIRSDGIDGYNVVRSIELINESIKLNGKLLDFEEV
ncbi:Gfo/Idh/MocA family protein [Lutibacter sp.]